MKLMILSFAFLVSAFQAHLTIGRPLTTRSVIDQLSLVTRYAGMGYNNLYANPEGDFYRGGVNPGIKTTRFIFNHTFNSGKRAFYRGQTMSVPDQVEFHMTQSCVREEMTNAYSGQTSYKNELSQSVEASGKYTYVTNSNVMTLLLYLFFHIAASYESTFSAHFALSTGR